jgi:hypothetical protein
MVPPKWAMRLLKSTAIQHPLYGDTKTKWTWWEGTFCEFDVGYARCWAQDSVRFLPIKTRNSFLKVYVAQEISYCPTILVVVIRPRICAILLEAIWLEKFKPIIDPLTDFMLCIGRLPDYGEQREVTLPSITPCAQSTF